MPETILWAVLPFVSMLDWAAPTVSYLWPTTIKQSQKVSGTPFDTPGTLSGHFADTPEPGARRAPLWAPDTPRRTLRRTPAVFGDTPGDTPGPKGPRDSCSWPGGSQFCNFSDRHQNIWALSMSNRPQVGGGQTCNN